MDGVSADGPAMTALLQDLPAFVGGGECVDEGALIALRGGRLRDARAAAVEGHLAGCAECRALLRDLAVPVPGALIQRMTEATPKRRLGYTWGVVAALAAGVALMLIPRGGVPSYQMQGPFGGLQTTRAAAASTTFGPESRFKVLLQPEAQLEGAAPVLWVYTSRGDLPLKAAPQGIVTLGQQGALRVQAPARSLFDAPGAHTVHLVLAPAEATLELDGLSPEDARNTAPEARWITLDVEYQSK